MPTRGSFEEAQHVAQKHSSTRGSLRPLLPKKGWEPLKVPLRAKRSARHPNLQLTQGCPVPGCKIRNCTLRTHVQYRCKDTSPSVSASSASAASDVEASRVNILGTKLAGTQSLPGVPRDALHGLEGLPDSIAETPVFRRLFHEFFSRTYDRILVLLSPPPVDPSLKQAYLALAMTSPAYCLNVIASAENEAIMRKKGAGQDLTATLLYGKLMSILRKQVALETAEIDNLLLILCTLATFDIVHNNISNLDVHRQGMVQLVNRVGGVHNLGHSLTIVLNLDRMVAIYSGELPAYARLIDRSIQRPSKYPEVYASFFSTDGKACIDQEVCDFCCDMARAFELFEGAQISYDPAIANKIRDNDVLYFYFSRQRVADHFTLLNHKYWALPSRSRCVLLAAMILDYTILVDNYINVIPGFLASKVKETLENLKANSPETWKGHEDVLIWVLYVLVTVPQPTPPDDWAMKSLREILVTKYNGVLGPLKWMKEELRSMMRFVWCSSRLDEVFSEVCNELTGSATSVVEVQPRNRVDDTVDSESDTNLND